MVKITQVKGKVKITQVKGKKTNKVKSILTDELHSEYYFTSGNVSDDKVITRDQINSIAELKFFGISESVIEAVFELCENCWYGSTSPDNFEVYYTGKIVLGGAMAHIAAKRTSYKDLYNKFKDEQAYNSIKIML